MKQCRKCMLIKPINEFNNLHHTADGKHSYCKLCNNLKTKNVVTAQTLGKLKATINDLNAILKELDV